MIISAFPGCGKTTLGNKYKNVIDLESSLYKYFFDKDITRKEIEERKATPREKNPEYPKNYIKAIQEAIKNYDIVLTSCGPLIRSELKKNKLENIVVYPSIDCKDEYIQRYIDRGNHSNFINHVKKNFEEWIKKFDEDKSVTKIKMKKGETLEDVLIKNNLLYKGALNEKNIVETRNI